MKRISPLLPLFTAIAFPLLLHRQTAGINVVLLDLPVIALLIWSGRLNMRNKLMLLVTAGLFLTSLMCLVYSSDIAVTMNIISLILLAGLMAAPELSVLFNALPALAVSFFTAPYDYFRNLAGNNTKRTGRYRTMTIAAYIVIPLIVLFIFVSLYSAASPYFNQLTGNFIRVFERIAEYISPEIFWLAVAGFAVGVILFFGRMITLFTLEIASLNLNRKRRMYSGPATALKTEAKSAVILLVMLNITLLVMNMLDLWHVWINFEWDGGFLKQFVHEGTWLLILSIIISIAIVLWYFRGNLNFYKGNRSLILLTRVWLAQNLFLALSVGLRNFWYLHYFNLAYKRIGVFVFLLLVIIGLITVIIKVEQRKTLKYLMVRNSIFIYVVVTALSLVNWDMVIARFNLARADKAFFHTDFMVNLDYSTLPVLLVNEQERNRIAEAQKKMFMYHDNYTSMEDYNLILLNHKKVFLEEYPQRNFLSWNLTDYITYRRLN